MLLVSANNNMQKYYDALSIKNSPPIFLHPIIDWQ